VYVRELNLSLKAEFVFEIEVLSREFWPKRRSNWKLFIAAYIVRSFIICILNQSIWERPNRGI
jgi:hypothetical protein